MCKYSKHDHEAWSQQRLHVVWHTYWQEFFLTCGSNNIFFWPFVPSSLKAQKMISVFVCLIHKDSLSFMCWEICFSLCEVSQRCSEYVFFEYDINSSGGRLPSWRMKTLSGLLWNDVIYLLMVFWIYSFTASIGQDVKIYIKVPLINERHALRVFFFYLFFKA